MNGYNFTDRVRKVLQMARDEAVRLHHEYVGTEHILLGILREGEGVAAAALTNLNVDFGDVTARINETVKEGKYHGKSPDLPYTSRAKKILEMARKEILRILGREPPQSAAVRRPFTGRRLLHPESADQLFTFAIAFIELYRLRDGTYPDSLEALPFLSAHDRHSVVSGLRYEKRPDGYALDVVTPEGEKPALSYPPDFWRGLGIRRTNVDRSSP